MVDPSDYLHAQIRRGSGRCQIVDGFGREILACVRKADRDAIRSMRVFIDQLIEDRNTAKG